MKKSKATPETQKQLSKASFFRALPVRIFLVNQKCCYHKKMTSQLSWNIFGEHMGVFFYVGQNGAAWNSALVSESMKVHFTFTILTPYVHDLFNRILFLFIQVPILFYNPPKFLDALGIISETCAALLMRPLQLIQLRFLLAYRLWARCIAAFSLPRFDLIINFLAFFIPGPVVRRVLWEGSL